MDRAVAGCAVGHPRIEVDTVVLRLAALSPA
jgi:hypothetical protein